MTEIVATGRVIAGKLHTRNRARIDAELAKWKDGEVLVTVAKAHATRSVDQNAVYWVGYIKPLAEHTGYTPLQMHAYCKRKFLPSQHLVIQDAHGVVIDEADIDTLTTTSLNNVEFGQYLHEIAEFAQSLGVEVGSNREAA